MAQTLYRKYRSQRFAELVGQTAITRVLRNSITRGRVNHAYLFAGPRGTGKTSVARIFAKALNCLAPQEGDACGQCEVCRAVAAGTAPDVIEIDAASNRGIDDVRALRERVNYAPLELRYKVYIIDEVHMITGPGFNALLKTLEEPPAHVVFCLCTTEAHKLPLTILSRCIRFDFRRLPLEALADHLQWIAGEEGQVLQRDAALQLAELAEGSARDAISLLDQLTAYCEGGIDTGAIRELFQLADAEAVTVAADSMAGDSPRPLLAVWHSVMEQGMDAGRFLLRLADELKRRYVERPGAQARAALEAVWRGANMLKQESFPALLVELTLIEAQAAWHQAGAESQPAPGGAGGATEQPGGMPTALREKLRQQAGAGERKPAPAALSPAAEPASRLPARAGSLPAFKPALPPAPAGRERPAPAEEPAWARFLDTLRGVRVTTYSLVFNCQRAICAGGTLEITFGAEQKLAYSVVQKPEHAKYLLQVAASVYGPSTTVVVCIEGQASTRASLGPVAAPASLPLQNEPPPELTAEVLDALPPPAGDELEPDLPRLQHDAEALHEQLRIAEEATAEGKRGGRPKPPVTAQDAMCLFEAVEIDEEEMT